MLWHVEEKIFTKGRMDGGKEGFQMAAVSMDGRNTVLFMHELMQVLNLK